MSKVLEKKVAIEAQVAKHKSKPQKAPKLAPEVRANIDSRQFASDAGSSVFVVSEGDELVISSNKQITLRCGKASITLKADGQIEIRGTDLTSRAAGQNLVRGASISLN
jgi:uncharacterized protein (DUF2345 family)